MKNIDYITAGAGSGKTYTLTNRLVKLIKDEGYGADQVILTTFSKLAASEFKDKAREELLTAKMVGEAVKLEGAQIGTVHAVANNFISKYWYLLGRGAESNVISDNDQELYIKQSLASIVERENLQFFAEICAEFGYQKSMSAAADSDFWREHLKSVIERSLQYDIEEFSQSVSESHKVVDSMFNRTASEGVVDVIISFLKQYITAQK